MKSWSKYRPMVLKRKLEVRRSLKRGARIDPEA